jgi:hypothetical protein
VQLDLLMKAEQEATAQSQPGLDPKLDGRNLKTAGALSIVLWIQLLALSKQKETAFCGESWV